MKILSIIMQLSFIIPIFLQRTRTNTVPLHLTPLLLHCFLPPLRISSCVVHPQSLISLELILVRLLLSCVLLFYITKKIYFIPFPNVIKKKVHIPLQTEHVIITENKKKSFLLLHEKGYSFSKRYL